MNLLEHRRGFFNRLASRVEMFAADSVTTASTTITPPVNTSIGELSSQQGRSDSRNKRLTVGRQN